MPPKIGRRIPKIIWQTWRDENVPPAYQGASQGMRKSNPSWEWRLMTDRNATQLFEEYFAGNISDAFQALTATGLGAARADLIRYAVLYVYGGVYVDFDSTCSR